MICCCPMHRLNCSSTLRCTPTELASVAPNAAVTPSGTLFSLNANEDSKSIPSASPSTTAAATAGTPKSKRATSFIRKKPPLERGLSAQSALRVNKNAFVCK